jgi:hypothetical protein
LSGEGILEQTLDRIVGMAHKGLVVYHVNRDSTAISAREKALKKAEKKAAETAAKKRGRPPKNSTTPPPCKEPTTIEKQTGQDAETSLDTINKNCAWGCKKTAKGMSYYGNESAVLLQPYRQRV